MIGLWAVNVGEGSHDATRAALWRLAREAAASDLLAPRVYEHADAQGGLKQPAFLVVASDPRRATKLMPLELDVTASAAFETTGALAQPSEHRASNGLLVGLTDCASPERLADFHDWYDNTHAADVIKSPFYWRARRFRRAGGELPEYLALYDTEHAEPETFGKYLEWPERDATMCDACLVRHVWTFNRIATETN